jgi:hypothetical protein
MKRLTALNEFCDDLIKSMPLRKDDPPETKEAKTARLKGAFDKINKLMDQLHSMDKPQDPTKALIDKVTSPEYVERRANNTARRQFAGQIRDTTLSAMPESENRKIVADKMADKFINRGGDPEEIDPETMSEEDKKFSALAQRQANYKKPELAHVASPIQSKIIDREKQNEKATQEWREAAQRHSLSTDIVRKFKNAQHMGKMPKANSLQEHFSPEHKAKIEQWEKQRPEKSFAGPLSSQMSNAMNRHLYTLGSKELGTKMPDNFNEESELRRNIYDHARNKGYIKEQ